MMTEEQEGQLRELTAAYTKAADHLEMRRTLNMPPRAADREETLLALCKAEIAFNQAYEKLERLKADLSVMPETAR